MAVSPEELVGDDVTSRPHLNNDNAAPQQHRREHQHQHHHAAAGVVAAAREVSREELLDALTCPIAGKLFVDPVTSPCGRLSLHRIRPSRSA